MTTDYQRYDLNIFIHKYDELRDEMLFVQVFDMQLQLVRRYWAAEEKVSIPGIAAGAYLVSVSDSTGAIEEKVTAVGAGEVGQLVFDWENRQPKTDFDSISQHFYSLFFSKTWDYALPQDSFELWKAGFEFTITPWQVRDDVWVRYGDVVPVEKILTKDRILIKMNQRHQIDALEITMDLPLGRKVTQLVLVVGDNRFIEIAASEMPGKAGSFIQVNAISRNPKVHALGRLMARGDLSPVKDLINLEDAIDLLHKKRQYYADAAMGGYYLLKAGFLDRYYQWAINLANWFPDMSDGAILIAWLFINQSVDSSNTKMKEIREWLLTAVRRGLPLYFEGLRLLYEGLSQLDDYYGQKDSEIQRGVVSTRQFLERADPSRLFTTFVDFRPVEYSNQWERVGDEGRIEPVKLIPDPVS